MDDFIYVTFNINSYFGDTSFRKLCIEQNEKLLNCSCFVVKDFSCFQQFQLKHSKYALSLGWKEFSTDEPRLYLNDLFPNKSVLYLDSDICLTAEAVNYIRSNHQQMLFQDLGVMYFPSKLAAEDKKKLQLLRDCYSKFEGTQLKNDHQMVVSAFGEHHWNLPFTHLFEYKRKDFDGKEVVFHSRKMGLGLSRLFVKIDMMSLLLFEYYTEIGRKLIVRYCEELSCKRGWKNNGIIWE